MAYTKPQIIAQNSASGSYAAGCPEACVGASTPESCKRCERVY